MEALPGFIAALAGGNIPALMAIPGVTPQMIGAGLVGLREAYILGFRDIWITAGVFSFVAAVAACFFVKPTHMGLHVDAPLETSRPVQTLELDS